MSERTWFGRQMPAEEHAAHCSHADDLDRSPGRLAEEAVVSYLPAEWVPDAFRTGMHDLEDAIQAMREHRGLPEHFFSEKETDRSDTAKKAAADSWSGETVKCNWYLDDRLQRAICSFAAETYGTDHGTAGVVLANATRAYRDERPAERLLRQIDAICDDVDGLPGTGDRDTDMVRRVRATIEALPAAGDRDQYHRRVLEEAVTSPDGGDVSGDPEPYVQRVLDRLGLVESPLTDCVFVTESKYDGLREQQLAGVDELSPTVYEGMARSEKVEYLRRRLRARAEQSQRGVAALTYREIMDDVFNGLSSASHTYTLMDEATEGTGEFRFKQIRGNKHLMTDRQWDDAQAISAEAAFGVARERTFTAAKAVLEREDGVREGGVELRDDILRTFLANGAGEGVTTDDVPVEAIEAFRDWLGVDDSRSAPPSPSGSPQGRRAATDGGWEPTEAGQ